MKQFLSMTLTLLITLIIVLFIWLRPISTNLLNYFIWKASTTTKIQTGHIDFQGAHIQYACYGHGEPTLLLHGGLSNKLSWFSQVPWLLASGRQVILIDTRGHGDSSPGNVELSYEIFAADTLLVLDKLGIQRTDIVGWSDGGIIALFLALDAPQRVRRIVAISANFHPSGIIADTHIAKDHVFSAPLNKIKHWLHRWWSGAGDNHTALKTEINKLWLTSPQFNAIDLRSIEAPTLVIAGENDIIDLPHSGDLAQHLSNGKLEIILGAGHAAPITHARQINELIANFMGIATSQY